jgi:hypothetical protein
VLPSQRTAPSGSSRPESLLSPYHHRYFPSTPGRIRRHVRGLRSARQIAHGFLSSDVTADVIAIFPKSSLKSRHSFISEHRRTVFCNPFRKFRLDLEIPATNADRFISTFTLLSDSFKEPKS